MILYNPEYTQKTILFGEPFFKSFNVSLDFDESLVGLEGYITPPPVDPIIDPTDPEEEEEDDIDDIEEEENEGKNDYQMPEELMIFIGILLLCSFVLALVYCIIKSRKRN